MQRAQNSNLMKLLMVENYQSKLHGIAAAAAAAERNGRLPWVERTVIAGYLRSEDVGKTSQIE